MMGNGSLRVLRSEIGLIIFLMSFPSRQEIRSCFDEGWFPILDSTNFQNPLFQKI